MTATDELRQMLDERGAEWDYGITGATTTRFSVNGIDLTFTPMRDGLVCSTILTPEQAIAATLGVDAKPTQAESLRTCHRLPADNYDEMCIVRSHGYEREFGYWKCSECGTNCFEGARYCMNCGAKVVNE